MVKLCENVLYKGATCHLPCGKFKELQKIGVFGDGETVIIIGPYKKCDAVAAQTTKNV